MVDSPRIITINLGIMNVKVETITGYVGDDDIPTKLTNFDIIGLSSERPVSKEVDDAVEVIILDVDGVEIVRIKTRDGKTKVVSTLKGSGHMSPTLRF